MQDEQIMRSRVTPTGGPDSLPTKLSSLLFRIGPDLEQGGPVGGFEIAVSHVRVAIAIKT